MKHYKWQEVPREEMNPRFARRVIHGERITAARIELAQGAIVPEHAHENEQITMLERGKLRFTFHEGALTLSAGESLVIPPNAPHAVEALEDSLAIDVFSPARQDWISGNDAYLRSPKK